MDIGSNSGGAATTQFPQKISSVFDSLHQQGLRAKEAPIERIFQYLAPCAECTGSYVSEILGMKFVCCCPCHIERKDVELRCSATIMFNNLSANSTLRVWRKKRRRRRRKIFKKIHYNQSPKSILNLIKNCKNGKLIQLPVVGEKTKAH
jgi:hypothetical protein